jgi:protein gp37
MAGRLQAMGQKNYARGFELTLQPHMLDLPLLWKKPQRIVVNSMSDLLHADVPHDDVMTRASWHQFQVLTKRADRLADVGQHLPWPDNVWMGAIPLARAPAWTVAESRPRVYRLGHRRRRIRPGRQAHGRRLGG